jgi:hypothetical protein
VSQHEDEIDANTKSFKKLEEKTVQQAKEICELNTESMCAFILFMY